MYQILRSSEQAQGRSLKIFAAMSQSGVPVVQRGMRRSISRRKGTVGLIAAAAILGGGCGSRLEVLHELEAGASGAGATSTMGSGGSEHASGGAAGSVSGGAASGGAPTAGGVNMPQAISICGPGASDSASAIAALTNGLACINADWCEPNACAAMGAPDGTGMAAFATCRNHQAHVVTMTLLDSDPSDAWSLRDDGVTWDDCESALAEGMSGQACTWKSTSCIAKTSDPCCLEGAECLEPLGLLHRVRVCAPGCMNARADVNEPVVTDCASAANADTCHATVACDGDFICYNELIGSPPSAYTASSQLNGAMWCADGKLVGGLGLTWGI